MTDVSDPLPQAQERRHSWLSWVWFVPITAAAGTLSVGAATRLFKIPLNDITLGFASPFDVSPDGQRFLLNVPDTPSPLLYIRGFQRLLK